MTDPDHDPSVEHEPHLRPARGELDASEWRAADILHHESAKVGETDAAEHTVWEEPSLATEFAGSPPADQVTYSRWLEKKISETSTEKTWLVTLGIVLACGPWGVLGALTETAHVGRGASLFGLVAATIIGPLTEEIMKIAITLWVVEKRPYLFKTIFQILVCAVAGGLTFAAIENFMYLHVYIPNPTDSIERWRWTVCTGLHMNCSFVAGIGLARIWDNAIREKHRPQLGLGMPWIFTAIVGHGLYNFGVFWAEAAGWLRF